MSYDFQTAIGNLVKLDADFIVNASNTKLILGSGVSMAFKRHCGSGLQQKMDGIREELILHQTPIKQGDVVATSSCNAINFTYALHAAVINYEKGVSQTESKPSLQTIETILFNTEPYLQWFSQTFGKKATTAFPYLGCGVGGLNKTDVLHLFERFADRDTAVEAVIVLCDWPDSRGNQYG